MRLTEEDREWIKEAYIAGTPSLRKLAAQYEISEGAIRKWAKAQGWERGAVNAPPRKALIVRESVRAKREPDPPPISPTITAAAAANHGELVKRTRRTLELLQAELDAEGVHVGFLEEIFEAETADDKDPRRYNAMMKAISLPTRILAAKNLALALKTLEDSAPGKKQMAQDAAETAGEGTEWGDDLNVGAGARAN